MTGRHSADALAEFSTPPTGRPDADTDTDDGLAERGALRIDGVALRRIVERVADEFPATRPAPRTIAGLDAGEHGATARIAEDGDDLDIRLDLALHYPIPVRAAVADLREQVTAELLRCTGKRVRSLTVTVSALLPDTAPRVE